MCTCDLRGCYVQVRAADEHYLEFARRNGQGILWTNSLITDQPYHASPLLIAATGITQLVPGQPNAPLTQVTQLP
jgi:hypothetical protein